MTTTALRPGVRFRNQTVIGMDVPHVYKGKSVRIISHKAAENMMWFDWAAEGREDAHLAKDKVYGEVRIHGIEVSVVHLGAHKWRVIGSGFEYTA